MSEETYPAGPAVMQLREAGRVERRIGVIPCLLFVHILYVHMNSRLYFVYVIFCIYSLFVGFHLSSSRRPAGGLGVSVIGELGTYTVGEINVDRTSKKLTVNNARTSQMKVDGIRKSNG